MRESPGFLMWYSNGIPVKPWHKQDVLVARRWNSNENTTSQRYYRRIAKWNVTTAIGWIFNLNVCSNFESLRFRKERNPFRSGQPCR